jgi:hypothetical protein
MTKSQQGEFVLRGSIFRPNGGDLLASGHRFLCGNVISHSNIPSNCLFNLFTNAAFLSAMFTVSVGSFL